MDSALYRNLYAVLVGLYALSLTVLQLYAFMTLCSCYPS